MTKTPTQKKTRKKTPSKQKTKHKLVPKKVSRIAKLRHLALDLMSRRPHRSFRKTMRRDYQRSLVLPGYFAFTAYVISTLLERKSLYLKLILISSLVTIALVGIGSQENFSILSGILRDTGSSIFEGAWGEVGKASLLLVTGMTGSFTAQMSEVQQVYAALIGLLTWLVVVWLLRAQLANQTPRLRDGLYNSGSPIVSTAIVFVFVLLQALPAAIAIIAYTTAASTDFLANGVIAMVFFLAAILLVVLSIYLVTSTFFALVVVTLPGMYPWQALRTAGDLVIGRRVRILLRLLWMVFVVAAAWTIIMLPIIVFTSWLQNTFTQIAWVPIVPVCLVFASSVVTIFVAAYIYLLYRKVVDDSSSPA